MDDWPYESLILKLKAVLAEADARPEAGADLEAATDTNAAETPARVSPSVARPPVKRVSEAQ